MTNQAIHETPAARPLRLWPGVVAVVLQWLGFLAFVLPVAPPGFGVYGLFTALVAGLVVVVWWLFFSRAPWLERVAPVAVIPVAVVVARRIADPSIQSAGMGNFIYFFSVPLLCLALVAWAAASRRLSSGARLASMAGALLVGCGAIGLLRSGGVSGDGQPDMHWRWTPTPEDRLLAQATPDAAAPDSPTPAPATPPPTAAAATTPEKAPAAAPAADRAEAPGSAIAPSAATAADEPAPVEWPGFRGPDRDGVARGARIASDWAQSPPVELWRRAIGPGWSSFAVHGDLLYTQEQRGSDEIVACYRLSTGEPVWKHKDAARFFSTEGGAGPRGTPTLAGGRVYAFGATGILNALDAGTGALAWARDVAKETGVETPGWGFAASPLVVGDVVIVAASGRLAAYDTASGRPRWQGPEGGAGYSSPQLATIGGVPQVLLLRGARSTSVAPADGTLLWEDKAEPSVSILQPAVTSNGDVLVASGDMMGGTGIRRLAVSRGDAGWKVEERWSSRGLKPYFNDFVVHEGHAYGFDASILSCIDLADGKRKWKGGRYGHGQLVLLPDQDLLLVLSEDGELALVQATSDAFTERARVPAIQGKTWNHPVLVGDVLLIRNGQEMAAFRLARAGG